MLLELFLLTQLNKTVDTEISLEPKYITQVLESKKPDPRSEFPDGTDGGPTIQNTKGDRDEFPGRRQGSGGGDNGGSNPR